MIFSESNENRDNPIQPFWTKSDQANNIYHCVYTSAVPLKTRFKRPTKRFCFLEVNSKTSSNTISLNLVLDLDLQFILDIIFNEQNFLRLC